MKKIITNSIPILAVAPTACVVYAGLVNILPVYPEVFAFAGGAAIEIIGFLTVGMATRMTDFNAQNKNRDERTQFTAPTWQTWLLLSLYLCITIIIAVFLDVYPVLSKWVTALFPLLGLSGGWLNGLQQGQNKREEEREAMRKRKKQVAPKPPAKPKQVTRKPPVPDTTLLNAWRKHPQASNKAIGDLVGLTAEAVRLRKKKMVKNGSIRIVHGTVEIERK